MSPEWESYGHWWTLWVDGRGERKARVYHPDYKPKWIVRIFGNPDEFIQLDPDLTLEEVKAVCLVLTGVTT